MNHKDLDSKILGIAFWQKKDDGENDVIMASGRCYLKGSMIYMKIGEINKEVPILKNWMDRIKELHDKEIKKIFHDADYGLSLAVKDLPEDADLQDYEPLMLKI